MQKFYKKVSVCALFAMLGIHTAQAIEYTCDFTDGKFCYQFLSKANHTVALDYPDPAMCPKYSGDVVVPSTVEYEGVTYTVTEIAPYGLRAGTATTGLLSVKLPATIKKIGHDAMMGNTQLTSVEMHEGIDSIMSYAFANCSRIASITIPDGVKFIGANSFMQMANLTEISIPNSVTVIDEAAFMYDTKLAKVVIGDSVQGIPPYCFNNCRGLNDVTLGQAVEVVGPYSFSMCSKLERINLPASLQYINDNSFQNMAAFREFTVDASNPYLRADDGILYSKDKKILYKWPQVKEVVNLEIPEGVETLGCGAFDHMPCIESVKFPSSLRTIGEVCFWLCNGLTKVEFSEGVRLLKKGAFTQCTKLDNVVLPSTVEEIGHSVFNQCSVLRNLKLNEGLQTIGNSVFTYCNELTEVNIPSTVTSIGVNLFSGSPKVVNINVAENNSKYSSIDGLLYTKDKKMFYMYMPARQDTAFTIPGHVEVINEYAFENASNLTYVNTGNGTRLIDTSAFYGCTNLKEVILGEKLDSLSEGVFSRDNKIMIIRSKNPVPPKVCQELPALSYTKATLYVPHGAKAAYQAAYPWSQYVNIEEEIYTGIKEIEDVNHGIEVVVRGNQITVIGAGKSLIEVYSISGQNVYKGYDTNIYGLNRGIYIIKVKGLVKKVSI